MNVAVMGSGSGTILEAVYHEQMLLGAKSPYRICAVFSDRQCRCQELAKQWGIPALHLPLKRFLRDAGFDDIKDPVGRRAYDIEIVRMLMECGARYGFQADVILLAGYMRLVTSDFLRAFPNKVLNVHPADLTTLDATGRRRYVGAHAVYDALTSGESQTRSSVILVDDGIDTGPLLVSGPWVSYEEGEPVDTERAKKHQERQKELSDWPACVAALKLMANGRLGLSRDGKVLLDSVALPKAGVDMAALAEVL